MGTLLTSFLALVLGQPGNEPSYHNTFSHQIPFNVDPTRRAEIREIRLYKSSDNGKSWGLYRSATPDQTNFRFDAPSDGVYWFRIAAVNQKGKQEPENIYNVSDSSTIKMVIDSLKPLVQLVSPQRQADDVKVSWRITEQNPDPSKLVLEYQLQGSTSWIPVAVTPGPTGTASIRPGSSAGLSLRMTFTDKAGNQSQQVAEVPGTAITTAGFAPGATSGTAPPPPPPPPPVEPVSQGTGSGQVPPPPATFGSTPTPVQPPLNPPVNPPVQQASVAPPPLPSETAMNMTPPKRDSIVPRDMTPPPPAANNTSPFSPSLVASSDSRLPRATGYGGARQLPSIRYVNHRELALAYEITREGPSHVGTVELWWTPDDGKTWEKAPPPPLEDAIINMGSNRRQRVIDLQEGDGIYGFSLVIRSRAGLGKSPPRVGEAPEMRVELDTVKPLAQLFKPQADPNRRDTLVLTWSAKDKNLAATPISLEWAERPEGPWQPIGRDLANTGQFAWQLPPTMPVQVYLRIRVRDLAGNVGEAITPEPQLVDLTEPEGRLVDVIPPMGRP